MQKLVSFKLCSTYPRPFFFRPVVASGDPSRLLKLSFSLPSSLALGLDSFHSFVLSVFWLFIRIRSFCALVFVTDPLLSLNSRFLHYSACLLSDQCERSFVYSFPLYGTFASFEIWVRVRARATTSRGLWFLVHLPFAHPPPHLSF